MFEYNYYYTCMNNLALFLILSVYINIHKFTYISSIIINIIVCIQVL